MLYRPRYDLKTEVSLALLPTATMGAVLLLLERYSQQHLLFASLASSAFLIYLNPQHRTNGLKTLVLSQVAAALLGAAAVRLIGPGYASAMTGMVAAIAFMLVLDVMHPPAVSTALTFAFERGKTLPLFLIAVGLLVVLLLLQRASMWLIHRYTRAHPQSNSAHASAS